MLKYEPTEERAEQRQQTEYPAEAAPQIDYAGKLLATLATRERALAYIDRQQEGYADKLMATVQTEARTFRRSRTLTRRLAACMGILMALLVLIFVARGIIHGKWDWDMLASITGMTGVIGTAAVSSKTYKSAASELAAIEDLRAVGPLAECLAIEEKTIRGQVENALTRLLPRLQASDAGLLNTEQRACLTKALQGKNDELTVAILRAYEQVGDETALPSVEALACEPSPTPTAAPISTLAAASLHTILGPKVSSTRTAQVREAAQECLPALRARAKQQRASQTLLRGASANDVAPDTLLRAATAHTIPIEAEQLLRADTSERCE